MGDRDTAAKHIARKRQRARAAARRRDAIAELGIATRIMYDGPPSEVVLVSVTVGWVVSVTERRNQVARIYRSPRRTRAPADARARGGHPRPVAGDRRRAVAGGDSPPGSGPSASNLRRPLVLNDGADSAPSVRRDAPSSSQDETRRRRGRRARIVRICCPLVRRGCRLEAPPPTLAPGGADLQPPRLPPTRDLALPATNPAT